MQRAIIPAVVFFLFALFFAPSARALEGADGALTIERFDDGLTVAVWEDHTNPIVTVDVWIGSGSLVETNSKWGVAHFFEHLFYRGTEKRAPRESRDEIIAVGGYTSAGTWYDYTHFFNTVESSHLDLALDTITDSLMNLRITDEDIVLERAVVTEEIKQRLDDPSVYPWEEMLERLFPGHGYGRRIVGTEASVSNLTVADFNAYYESYFSPENVVIVLAGDVEPERAISLAREKLSGWKAGADSPGWGKPRNRVVGFETSEVTGKYNYPQVNIGFRVPGFKHPDRYALEVAEHLLVSGKNALLKRLIGGDVLSVTGGYGQYRHAGSFILYVSPAKGIGLSSAAAGILNSLSEFAETEPTEEEVKSAIDELSLSIRFYQADTRARARLIGEAITYGNPDYYLKYRDNLAQVSASDVHRVVNSYFVKENCRIMFMRPQPDAASGGGNELESALQSLPVSAEVDFDKTLHPDAVETRKGAGVPPAPALSDSFEVVLDDGMKAIIIDRKGADISSMGVFFPAGSAHDPPGKEGLTYLTLAMLEYGSTSLKRDEVWQRIGRLGNRYSFGADRDYSQVTLTTTADRARDGLDFLKKLLKRPTLDSGFLEEAKSSQRGRMGRAAEDIVSVGVESFKDAAFKGHPYSQPLYGTAESLSAITSGDLSRHWERMANPSGAVFIFVGDADAAGLTSDVESSIGRILFGAGTPFEPAQDSSVGGLTGAYQVNLKRQQNLIVIGARVPGQLDNPDFGALMILGSTLSLWGFEELVYEQGLAYRSVGTYLPWREGGVLMLYLGYSQLNEAKVLSAIGGKLGRLASAPVTDEELRSVKGFITGYQALILDSPENILYRFGQWEMQGAGYDFLNEFIAQIESATALEVKVAAAKFLSGEKLLQIIVRE